MHRIDVKIEQLKSLLIRAAEVLETSSDAAHSQLVQELRKAAEQSSSGSSQVNDLKRTR
jgi:hypothetical protein